MRHMYDKLPEHEALVMSSFKMKSKNDVRSEVTEKIVEGGAQVVQKKMERMASGQMPTPQRKQFFEEK